MNQILPDNFIFPALSLGSILLALWGILTCTIWISFRLLKVELPKLRFLFAITFLLILLGILTVIVVMAIQDEILIGMGIGLGVTILSGLFFIKMILKKEWKQSLRVWAVAAAMQLVLMPVCLIIMVMGLFIIAFILHPPQL